VSRPARLITSTAHICSL